jgi:hypothetical protein
MTVLSEIGDKTFFAAAVRLLFLLRLALPAFHPPSLWLLSSFPRPPVWLRSFVGEQQLREVLDVMPPSIVR